jgi:hypothetical protein
MTARDLKNLLYELITEDSDFIKEEFGDRPKVSNYFESGLLIKIGDENFQIKIIKEEE